MANIIRFGGGGGASKKKLAISNLTEGTIVRIKEKGVEQDYYLAQHDYQPSLNGSGRVLFVRKDGSKVAAYSATSNAFVGSDVDTWLNGEFLSSLDAAVREAIGTTMFPYTPGGGNNTLTTLSKSVFLLSLAELGISYQYSNAEGAAVPIANTLKVCNYNGAPTLQWTRTPLIAGTGDTSAYVNALTTTGGVENVQFRTDTPCYRPAFTLPASFSIEQNSEGTYDLVYESDYPMGYLELTIVGGTTQPENPAENTIWVNTDVDMGMCYLAPNAPASPEVGDVWVNTTNKYNSNGTNASTNLIRVNDNPYLEINVLNISQWNGSAWANREGSAIYANGGWTNMALWLFNRGTVDEGHPLTGVSAAGSTTAKWSSDSSVISKSNDSLLMNKPNNIYYFGIYCTAPVDLSKYNKLKLIYRGKTNASNAKISVCIGSQPYTNASYSSCSDNGYTNIAITNDTAEKTLEWDISNVSGVGYPSLVGNYSGSTAISPFVAISQWCLTA